MEINRRFEMLPITKTIGHLPDTLNLGAKTSANRIGDSMPEIRQNLSQKLAEYPYFLNHRLQARVAGPEKPRLEMANRPGNTAVSPKLLQALFNRLRARCLQMHFLQTLK